MTSFDKKYFFCKKYSLFSTCENCYIWIVKIEEAIVYCLASSGRGMRSEQIADMINRQRLHLRKDGQPVTSKQVFYVVTHNAHTFALAEGRIMLII